jgi:hypothetical protein
MRIDLATTKNDYLTCTSAKSILEVDALGDPNQKAQNHFFLAFFLRGTFPPARRASDNPIAMACFRLVTFFPERPLRRVPLLRSRIARLTFCAAFRPYLAIRILLAEIFLWLRCKTRSGLHNFSRRPTTLASRLLINLLTRYDFSGNPHSESQSPTNINGQC